MPSDHMLSTFSWLDYSEHERRRMLEVARLFGEPTTVDELGLGSVRDAFADFFFPGTSTVQTRARYFLFVPWIYLRLEEKNVPSGEVPLKARKLEVELIKGLKDETWGVIGKRAQENVRRLPSNTYWSGLGVWGLRRFPDSQDQYHHSLDLFYLRTRSRRANSESRDGESADDHGRNWHAGLPPEPDGFPKQATFALTRHEAEYLRERIITSCPHSLLAYLLRERIDVADAPFAWELPVSWPTALRERLEHARNFSDAMHGAQLLYNLLLAEQCKQNELVDHYRDGLGEWWQRIELRRNELHGWDRLRFWTLVLQVNPRISTRARRFVDAWIDSVDHAPTLADAVDSPEPRRLIDARETELKRGLARLHNQRALELWTGQSGTAPLDFRWRAAQRILNDILAGLELPDA